MRLEFDRFYKKKKMKKKKWKIATLILVGTRESDPSF